MDESNPQRPRGLAAAAIKRARRKKLEERLEAASLSGALHAATPEEKELYEAIDEVAIPAIQYQKQAKNERPTLPSVLQHSLNFRPYIDRIDTSTSADWRKLHSEFTKLMDEEEMSFRARPGDVWLQGWYDARSYQANSGYNYSIHGDRMGTEFRERFSALGIQAGKLKGAPQQVDPLGHWLKSLYEAVYKHKARSRHDRLFQFGNESKGFIQFVCEASAWYCKRLEAEALKVEHSAGISIGSESRPNVPNAPLSDSLPSTRSAKRKMNNFRKRREGVAFAAIERGLEGVSYCKFLDDEKIGPLPDWISEGCPSTYVAAYRKGKPWIKRIQDEKHRFKVKYDRLSPTQVSSLIETATRSTR